MLIPAGTFTMGSEPETALKECEKYFSGCNLDELYLNELPVHEVTLNAFYMDVYEVTNSQYQECVAAGSCTPPSRNSSSTHKVYYDAPEFAKYPAIWVTWDQAQTYCEWRGARPPPKRNGRKQRGEQRHIYIRGARRLNWAREISVMQTARSRGQTRTSVTVSRKHPRWKFLKRT